MDRKDSHPDDGTSFVIVGTRPGFVGKQTFDTLAEADKVFVTLSNDMPEGGEVTLYEKRIKVLNTSRGPKQS